VPATRLIAADDGKRDIAIRLRAAETAEDRVISRRHGDCLPEAP